MCKEFLWHTISLSWTHLTVLTINSHPFNYESICPPISEIQTFQNLTLEIQGEYHNSRSDCGSNVLSTDISFVPCQSDLPPLRYSCVKFHLENPWLRSHSRSHSGSNIPLTHIHFNPHTSEIRLFQNWTLNIQVKVIVQSHNGSNIHQLLTCILFVPSQWLLPFLSWGHFNIWLWKSKVKVIDEVKSSRLHSMSNILTHIPLILCQSISNLDLEILRSMSYFIITWQVQQTITF